MSGVVDTNKETVPEDALQQTKPDYRDIPILHVGLAVISITALRREYLDDRPPVILFALIPSASKQGEPALHRFGDLLEIQAGLEHVINSVVASSTRTFDAPAAQPPEEAAKDTVEAKDEDEDSGD